MPPRGRKVHTRKRTSGIGAKRKMAKGGLIRAGSGKKPVVTALKKAGGKIKKTVTKAVTKVKKKKKPVVKGSGGNPRFMGSSTQKRDYNNSLKKKS
jgi:hypothetical protein